MQLYKNFIELADACVLICIFKVKLEELMALLEPRANLEF